MHPEEVMLPFYSLMLRLEHSPNFNSFFRLRPFHSPLRLICWESLSPACWVLMLKLSHFQSFSCASEPLGLKASLSDHLLDPEVPSLQRKGGMPCLGCPAGWWLGALLRWELQAEPDPRSLLSPQSISVAVVQDGPTPCPSKVAPAAG